MTKCIAHLGVLGMPWKRNALLRREKSGNLLTLDKLKETDGWFN